MLVLSRKPGESIKIEGPCVVTVLHYSKGKTRIGIQADREVRIVRTELETRAVDEEKARAASTWPSRVLVGQPVRGGEVPRAGNATALFEIEGSHGWSR